ncbi:MAG TPA: hypothetical protein VKU60_14060, partial [Chloroflexota bacterium]|nr:hypothetical protein [Chloroflexota bacterium]
MAIQAEFAGRVVGFCRVLRDNGFRVTPAHTTVAVRAVAAVDVGDRTDFGLALQAVLVSSPEQAALFERLFGRYWDSDFGPLKESADAEPEEELAAAAPDQALEAYSALEVLAHKD